MTERFVFGGEFGRSGVFDDFEGSWKSSLLTPSKPGLQFWSLSQVVQQWSQLRNYRLELLGHPELETGTAQLAQGGAGQHDLSQILGRRFR